MRVALLSTFNERCGIATYSEALSRALAERGAEVAIIAPHRLAGDPGRGVQPRRMWRRNRAFGFEAFAVHRALLAQRVDVVHLQVNLSLFSSRFAFNLAHLCARSGIAVVVTLHGRNTGSWGPDFKWARLRFAFRNAEIIVHAASHRAELGRDHVHVVAHGMDPIMPGNRQQARESLALPQSATVLTHFGFLVPDKGVAEVARAVATLRDEGRAQLIYNICGAVHRSAESRSYFEELVALTQELGLTDAVRLNGEFVDDERMLLEMQASDWIVLNYRTGNAQGASGAVRRALSSGRPVAVSAARVFDDVRDAVHTLEGPLASSLNRIFNDKALAEQTQAKARSFCEQQSWSAIAAQHERVYERALQRASGRTTRMS